MIIQRTYIYVYYMSILYIPIHFYVMNTLYYLCNEFAGMAHDIFLEFQKIKNHLEFWKKLKNSGTWKN